MATFVVELRYGSDRDRRMDVRPAHREYARGLADRGILLAGGPYTDDAGAQLIYQVADRAELDDVLARDPYTEAEVIAETTVREWNPVTGSWLG